MFFDLKDVTHVNSHIVYMKLGHDISMLNYKIVVAKYLIGRHSNLTTAILLDCSQLLDQASENFMTHLWSENSQPVCPSYSRSQ